MCLESGSLEIGIPESLITEILDPKSEFGAAICLHLAVTSCYTK
jgi:hypothetical protein